MVYLRRVSFSFTCQDPSWFSRFSAVQALPQIADCGDYRVVAALIDMLGDRDAHVRQAVAESLSELVFKDDRTVHRTLGACLED